MIVACANGLLDVGTRELLPHTPAVLQPARRPVRLRPRRARPRALARLPRRPLARRRRRHRGAAASGSATSSRAAPTCRRSCCWSARPAAARAPSPASSAALVGRENVAGPTLSSLSGDFGLAPLIGKPLAVVSDARLNGRDSQRRRRAAAVDLAARTRLTVDRKYREQWTGKLPRRFMLLSQRAAAARRRFGGDRRPVRRRCCSTASWLGKEDHDARAGAARRAARHPQLGARRPRAARARGHVHPAAGRRRGVQSRCWTSPPRCRVRPRPLRSSRPASRSPSTSSTRPGRRGPRTTATPRKTKQTFGRDLRAALPRVQRGSGWPGEDRERVYQGVGLKRDDHE